MPPIECSIEEKVKIPSESEMPAFIQSSTQQSTKEVNVMEEQKIVLSFGNEELKATMENNVTAADFVKRLPLKMDMRDLYIREKFAKVHGLHVDQTVSSHDKGDISYWTPGQALVIYYKDSNEYISGLVKIGEITEGVEVLENYPGNIEVTIDIEER